MSSAEKQPANRRSRSSFLHRDTYRLVVVEDEARTSYLQRTTEMINIDFPADYVDRAEVLTLVNQQSKLCGGVMLISNGPFRSIAGIPAEHRAVHEPLNSRKDVTEVNGLWLAPEMKSPCLSISFWKLLVSHLVKSNTTSFLFTFDNSNDRMKSLVFWLNPKKLYSGATIPLPGMKSASKETIALINIEPVKIFLKLLERRGIGADPEKARIRSRLENRSQRTAESF